MEAVTSYENSNASSWRCEYFASLGDRPTLGILVPIEQVVLYVHRCVWLTSLNLLPFFSLSLRLDIVTRNNASVAPRKKKRAFSRGSPRSETAAYWTPLIYAACTGADRRRQLPHDQCEKDCVNFLLRSCLCRACAVDIAGVTLA